MDMIAAFSVWLGATSVLWIGFLLVVALSTAVATGWYLRRRAPRKQLESDSLLTSAVLGLLALLLSFTFSLATERYEARRLLVQEEANAIGTMYLRTQLLEEPYRSQISQTLVEYTENRIALAQARPEQARPLLATNDHLIGLLWDESASAFPTIRQYDFSSIFYESVNRVVDLDATRKSARMAHVPPVVFLLLFVYVTVSAGLLGFFSQSHNALVQSSLFLVLLVLFLLVIIDIDQPALGSIRESQAPMERLRATLPPT